ncbi:hypothetical protein CYLTODRAFT_121418, partial [Cylindrobasidium torrendii FP15055 ss-10]
MEAVEKYVMEGAFEHLKRIIDAEMLKQNPLKTFAIARHLRWDDLTRRAAREALRHGIITAAPIPELKLFSAQDYQLLLRYFAVCSTSVVWFLLPTLVASPRGADHLFTRNCAPKHVLSVFSCTQHDYSGAYTLKCQNNGYTIEEVGLVSRSYNFPSVMLHAWFTDYFRDIFEDISLRPGLGVIKPSVLEQTSVKAELQCGTQKPLVVRAMLEWLNTEID